MSPNEALDNVIYNALDLILENLPHSHSLLVPVPAVQAQRVQVLHEPAAVLASDHVDEVLHLLCICLQLLQFPRVLGASLQVTDFVAKAADGLVDLGGIGGADFFHALAHLRKKNKNKTCGVDVTIVWEGCAPLP
jgi:hypothetical protein